MPSPISPAQLRTQLSQSMPAPIYALIGEEDLFRDTALTSLKTMILGDEGGDFNCDLLYGDEAEGSEIVACAAEVAVFASRRLVIVKAADKMPARQSETLLPYLKEPNDSTTIVFVAPKLDGRLKFSQALVRTAVIVDCSPLKESQWGTWLTHEAERAGVKLNENAFSLLREACGGSLYSVRQELEKLASYMPSGRPVTEQEVAIMRGTEPGASVFDLAAAIGSKKAGRALTILARNIEAGEAPLKILGSLVWQYRRLWKCKELMEQGGREGEAARALRMDPYKVRTFLGQFSEGHLRGALKAFQESDAKLKGGSSGRPAMILDRLILHMCERLERGLHVPAQQTINPPSLSTTRAKHVPNVRTITRGGQPRN